MTNNGEKISSVSGAHHHGGHHRKADPTSEFRRYMLNRKHRLHKMEIVLFWALMAVALALGLFVVTSFLFDVW